MLRISVGPRQQDYCDRVSRRSFMQIGGLTAMGSLSLPQILQAEQQSGKRSHKSIIMVYLSGGIAHQDTVDLKPNAPAEVRGEFKPIDTALPGFQMCELLPKLAQTADKLAVIRSIVGLRDEHSSFQTITGFGMNETNREGKPNFGSMVSYVQGSVDPVTPAYVDLFPTMQHKPYNIPGPGYLGRAVAGVRADGEDIANMRLRNISVDQFGDRKKLLKSLDDFRRTHDLGVVESVDVSYQRAFDVLTSSRLVEAMDVEKEDPKLREKYGKGSPKHQGDGAPQWNDQLLIARRLVESGVRCVTVAYGFWDTHGRNFDSLRRQLPTFDSGIAALVQDLHDRGLDRDVTVLVWGEFGRTPKINKDAGRDHWPRVNSAIFAGGGLKVGQVIGSTDKIADSAASRPVHYHDVLATAYKSIGIDPHAMIRDINDRPVPILPDSAHVIRELI